MIHLYAVNWMPSRRLVTLAADPPDPISHILERPVFVCDKGFEGAFTDGQYLYLSARSLDHSRNINASDVLRLLGKGSLFPAGSDECYSIRNYIEPGNPVIFDDLENSSFTYAVMGDTHHMPKAFTFAARSFEEQRYDLITSLSNPHHLRLFGSYTDCVIEYPAYGFGPLEEASKAIRIISEGHHPRRYVFTCCTTLNRSQVGRKMFIRKVIDDFQFLENALLYPYQRDAESYHHILRLGLFSIVPSLNGQFSPQITSALFAGSIPLIDSHAILGHDSSYQDLRSCTISRRDHQISDLIRNSHDIYKSAHSSLVQWLQQATLHRRLYPYEHEYFMAMYSNDGYRQTSIEISKDSSLSFRSSTYNFLDNVYDIYTTRNPRSFGLECAVSSITDQCKEI